ncbi:MAG: nucleoside triphosphate pyrophosphohydrolase family protein [Magnetovibrio sp.]|nr:nucleoside triphosphate pyrophosphohydrolase family protein [Magnetovibrio sp.]
MNIDDYADWAAGIVARHKEDGAERLSYLGLGLAEEAGEAVGHLKKRLRDGALDADGLADELGDVAYYWANLCLAIGKSPSDVLAASRAKIEAKLSRG